MISTTPICLLFILLLLTLNTAEDSGGVCQEFDCSSPVRLGNLVDQVLGEDNIFMIESSPKETLSSREGCALESAARNSELAVVMVRLGEILDLRDNTTCQIYTRSSL